MTKKVITASPNTNLKQAYDIMLKQKIGKLPLVKNGKLVGLYSFADVKSLIKNVEPLFNRDSNYRLRVAAAVGPNDHKRVELLNNEQVDILVVDTAHGHSKSVLEMIRWIKKNYSHIDVIGGNIATSEAALDLRKAGADAVKVGIGPGSICTTRVVTGVGVPQISAIYAVASVLKGSIPVISDGGIRHSGDVAKAIVAGANTVMMGSVLAGTNESPGEKILYEGRQYVIYRGMGSLDAMKSRSGSRERYGLKNEDELVPQGIEGMVPFSGSISKVIKQYCGGLQASLGYCGTKNINLLQKNGKFIRIIHGGTEGDLAQIKLKRKLHPFLLRRLKKHVAKDLPPKIERIASCKLTADQLLVYQQLLNASKNRIEKMVEKDGFNKSRMEILKTLLRLRQTCNHIDLLHLKDIKSKNPSGKMDLFFSLLNEAIDSSHRILVFSQFTGMLSILKNELEKKRHKILLSRWFN